MKLTKYQPVLIPGAIIFLAAASLLIFLPKQIGGLVKGWRQIKAAQKEIEELKAKYLLVSSLDQETLKTQAQLALAAVPEEKSVPLILQAVRRAIADAGFVIKTMKFAPGEVNKEEVNEKSKASKSKTSRRIEELPLELEVVGPYAKLSEMFESLETTLPLFQVELVEITSSQKVENRASAKLKLITFYSPPLSVQSQSKVALKDLVLTEEENSLLEKLSQFKLVTIKTSESPPYQGEEKSSGEKGRENPFVF